MIIVGKDLLDLIKRGLIDRADAFDNTSVTLTLDSVIKAINTPPNSTLAYGQVIPDEWITTRHLDGNGLVLQPQTCVLACSREFVHVPAGHFGFVETKGSLARLFISVHCNDGQVDPGYQGKITFELCNLGGLSVRLYAGQEIARLFVVKTLRSDVSPYLGRYQGAVEPTIQIPDSKVSNANGTLMGDTKGE